MTGPHRIRPIRTKRDHANALDRVGELMRMDNRTREEQDEYDVLWTLLKTYENEHFPVELPDPITAIKFRMDQSGITRKDLEPILGSPTKVSDTLSGKRKLTLKDIRALNESLGIDPDVLTGDWSELPPLPPVDLDDFPVEEMAKMGWIEKTPHPEDRTEEVVHELTASAGGPEAQPQALFRQGKGSRRNTRASVSALQAWCLYVLGQARRAGLEGIYRPGTINADFLRQIARLSIFDEGPKLVKEKLAKSGIAMVVAGHLSKTHLDGAALWTIEGVPVVGLTIRIDRLDSFWFCLLHELAHLARHFTPGDGEVFLDQRQFESRGAEHDRREREADEWAQEALIPGKLWKKSKARRTPKPSAEDVLELARAADVHPAIVAGRIRHERNNYRLLLQFTGADVAKRQLMGA